MVVDSGSQLKIRIFYGKPVGIFLLLPSLHLVVKTAGGYFLELGWKRG